MVSIRRLLCFWRPHFGLHILSLVLAVAAQCISYAMPLFNMMLVDQVMMSHNYDRLLPLASGLFVTLGVSHLLSAASVVCLSIAQEKDIADLRLQVFKHTLRLSFPYLLRSSSGHLTSRIFGDASSAASIAGSAAHDMILSILSLVGAASVMFWLDVQMAAVAISIVPVFLCVMTASRTRLRAIAARIQEGSAALMERIQLTLGGISTVRAFSAESTELSLFSELQQALQSVRIEQAKVSALYSTTVNVVLAFGQISVFVYGSFRVIRNTSSVGEIVAFTSLVSYLYGPCQRLVSSFLTLQSALSATTRTLDLLSKEAEPVFPALPELVLKSEIKLDGVYFGYNGTSVLKDVSMTIPRGSFVSIVGPSGTGKSTLCSLILGLTTPSRGVVTVDGAILEGALIPRFRRIIGYVSQEPYLWPGTVKHNILYGLDGVRPTDMVLRLLHGIDLQSTVLRSGQGLSVGQKQRVALARALCRNPQVLLLDEPTSSLDRESEEAVMEVLSALRGSVTIIMFSHRVTTVRESDLIFVLNGGMIEDRGSHSELLERNEFYRRQFGIEQEGVR